MSSGQPKACWVNIEIGRYVMLDHWPYKPFKITAIGKHSDFVRLQDVNSPASISMTAKQFDKAGYVFAEANHA